MKFKIFISYSTHDLIQVEFLKQQLVDTPIEVFIAEYSIQPSEDLESKITSAIKGCDLFVVLWSSNAENSKWVSQEIGHAKAFNKTILPLVLHENIVLPGFVSNLKYLPIYQDPDTQLKQAKNIIIDLYSKKSDELAKQEARKQKDKEQLFLVGAGLFLLWASSK